MHPSWHAAIQTNGIATPHEADAELEELQPSHVLFPPQMAPQRRDGGQPVVSVHDRVNDGVNDGAEEGLTRCHPFDANPPEEEHRGVMVDVQEGHLLEGKEWGKFN